MIPSDHFFYYGLDTVNNETRGDVVLNLVQPRDSLFYSRGLHSSGVSEFENEPINLNMIIQLPFEVVSSLSKRNSFVSRGENGNPNRQIAVSQSTVSVETRDTGEVDLSVFYIPLADFRQSEKVFVPLG